MKIFLITFITLFLSCNSNKSVISQSSHCPKNGNCSFKVLTNKSLEIGDSFGSTYLNVIDGKNQILKFEFVRNKIENVEDSSYTEQVFIELNSNNPELATLKNTKVYYGRLCFCRGQTGYYPITSGDFKITKQKNGEFTLNLEFDNGKVPQLIGAISEKFKL